MNTNLLFFPLVRNLQAFEILKWAQGSQWREKRTSNFTCEIQLIFSRLYKLKKIVGSNNFSAQFIKIISHYKKIGYNINVLQQTACLVVNPITVGNFAFLFNCTPVGRTSDYDGSDSKTYLLMRW